MAIDLDEIAAKVALADAVIAVVKESRLAAPKRRRARRTANNGTRTAVRKASAKAAATQGTRSRSKPANPLASVPE